MTIHTPSPARLAALLLGGVAATADAGSITFTKIADTQTPVPGGSGSFTRFPVTMGHAVSGNNVVFRGQGGNGQDGVYLSADGVLSTVADQSTIAPGTTGTFTVFTTVSLDGEDVAFGADSTEERGVYARLGGVLDVVADRSTVAPGSSRRFSTLAAGMVDDGNVSYWGFVPFSPWFDGVYISIDGTGTLVANETTSIPGGTGRFSGFSALVRSSGENVVFFGRDAVFDTGIYKKVGGTLHVVADKNTPIPGGPGNFGALGGHASIDGDEVAFRGANATQTFIGLYTERGGVISVVADVNTTLPDGVGTFLSFFDPSLENGNISFLGVDDALEVGVYARFEGTIVTVIRGGDQLDDKTVHNLSVGPESLSGDRIAFRVVFDDGSQGLYVARLGNACPEDLDGSGDVGFGDILAVLAAWGPCDGCPEDLDGSGDVGFGDILAVLAAWGSC